MVGVCGFWGELGVGFFKPFGEAYVLQSTYPKCWDSSFLIIMRKQKLFESLSNRFVLFV